MFSFASLTDNAQDDTTAVDSTSDRLTTNYSNRHRLNGMTSDNEVTEADAAAVPGDEDDSNARPAPQNGLSRRPRAHKSSTARQRGNNCTDGKLHKFVPLPILIHCNQSSYQSGVAIMIMAARMVS